MAGYRRGLRLPGSVVVVSGAGGAVRPTEAALTAHGAHPVLVDGGECPTSMQEAARDVVERRGRIDGWVQFVDAPARGGVLELTSDEVQGVLDGVVGAVHGARAALAQMVAQGSGVLVVVASVHAQVARPYGAAQGMAGAAGRVLAAALRQELRLGGQRGVAVTTVLAPEIDPRVGTFDGETRPGPCARPKDPPWSPGLVSPVGLNGRFGAPSDGAAGPFPIGSAERIAATVLSRLRHPGLEKVAGGPVAKAVVHGHALVPGLTEWLVARRSRPSARLNSAGPRDAGPPCG